MESFFRPNKWFVLFCAALVVIWLTLQYVINMRLGQEAKIIGQDIYTWSWPEQKWISTAQMTRADVLHRSNTDAIVRIQGKQVLTLASTGCGQLSVNQSKTMNCRATITFYKLSNNWVVGKVELE